MAIGTALAIGAVAQAGLGAAQYFSGRSQINNLERPTYQIPSEYRDILSSAQLRAAEGLPSEQKREFIENIERSQQSAMQAGSDRRAGLANIVDVQQQTRQAYSDLVTKDAQARRAAQQQLDKARMNMAQQKQQQFQINEMSPYQQNLQSAQALMGSGLQNIGGGISQGMSAGLQAHSANQQVEAAKIRAKASQYGVMPPGGQTSGSSGGSTSAGGI